jgi:hypothetical protein
MTVKSCTILLNGGPALPLNPLALVEERGPALPLNPLALVEAIY